MIERTRSSFLVRLNNESSENAWTEFVLMYQPLVTRTVRSMGVLSSDVEDLTQEIMVKLLNVLPSFRYHREKGCFRNWLKKVSKRCVIDYHRRRGAEKTSVNEMRIIAIGQKSSDEVWEKEFRLGLIECAIQTIKHEFRPKIWRCFLLYSLGVMTAKEVADIVGVSENAVFVNASRVTARIRGFCSGYYQTANEPVIACNNTVVSKVV